MKLRSQTEAGVPKFGVSLLVVADRLPDPAMLVYTKLRSQTEDSVPKFGVSFLVMTNRLPGPAMLVNEAPWLP